MGASYLLAQMFVQLPLLLLIALCSTVPSGFGIGNWSWKAFFRIEAIMWAMLCIYESIAQILAVVLPHPALAALGVVAFWEADFLFMGSFVRGDDLLWTFRMFSYSSLTGKAGRTLLRSELIHHTFSGAVRNPDGSFSCTNTLQAGCFGITGHEVLESMSQLVIKPHLCAKGGLVESSVSDSLGR